MVDADHENVSIEVWNLRFVQIPEDVDAVELTDDPDAAVDYVFSHGQARVVPGRGLG